jgi:hypothetical protein
MKTVTAPREELDRWDEWADELNMTRSKFIRCAVSAGVAKIDPPSFGTAYNDDSQSYRSEIRTAVSSGAGSIEGVVEAVLDEVEDDIRAELQEMIDTGQVLIDTQKGLVLDDTQS